MKGICSDGRIDCLGGGRRDGQLKWEGIHMHIYIGGMQTDLEKNKKIILVSWWAWSCN